MRILLLALLALPACDGKPDDTGDAADTGDTGADSGDADTEDTGDTGDTDTADTADTGDTGDTGEVDPAWAHCPDETAYVGDDAWTATIEATASAVYCGGSNEGRTLEQERAAKAKLKVVQGAWPVPHADGAYDLALPVCTLFADTAAQPGVAGAGTTDVSPTSYGGTTYTYLTGSQPMAATDGATWTLGHALRLVGPEGDVPAPLVLDGGMSDPTTGEGGTFTLYASGTSPYDVEATTFQPCVDDAWIRNVHTVTFDGGEIVLELYIEDNPIVTAPATLVRASGTLDGTAFDEDDYFQLVYKPDHHHFGRHFAVIFDAPIGEVCALRVEDVDGQAGTTTATVTAAGCDLAALGSRTVTAEDWTVGGR